MEKFGNKARTEITSLSDDCFCQIFERLGCSSDCESFGLTCRQWLHIQNSSRRSLWFYGPLTQLSRVSQNRTKIITAHITRLLNRFSQLESSPSGCTVLPDSGLAPLEFPSSNLQTLKLDCCFGLTNNGLYSVTSACPPLTVISISRCNISDIGLRILAKSCLALKEVDLSFCSKVSDDGVKVWTNECGQLCAVRITNCSYITGIGFQGCSQTLSYLEAGSCKLEPERILGILSGGELEYLNVLNSCNGGYQLALISAGSTSRLWILDFRFCRTVDDTAVSAIAKGCLVLEEWNLAMCHEVNLLGWESIGLYCRNLKKVHANRCRNLCDRGLQALREGCSLLAVFVH